MSFPTSPLNGQTATINNVLYVYNSTNRSWTRSTALASNVTVGILTVNTSLTVPTIAATTLTATTIGNATSAITANSFTGGSFSGTTVTGTVFTASSLSTSGPATIGGNLTVVGNINYTGNVINTTITGNTGQFFGNLAGFGALYAGIASGYSSEPQTILEVAGNFPGYVQINNQNINNSSAATTDIVATADTGSAGYNYIDMGITSSTYSQAGYGLTQANDGYLYVQGNSAGTSGNLILSTYNARDIVFSTGGGDYGNEIARFSNSSAALVIKATTSTTTANTGAVQVWGGISTQGNAFHGGSVTGAEVLASNGLHLNANTINTSYTVPQGYNVFAVGPITMASGVTMTLPSGSRYVVI